MQLHYLTFPLVALLVLVLSQGTLAAPVHEVIQSSYPSAAARVTPGIALLKRTDEIAEELLPDSSSPPRFSTPGRSWGFTNPLGTPSSPKGDAATRRWRKQNSQRWKLRHVKDALKNYEWKEKVKGGLVGTGRCVKDCLHTMFIDD